MAIKQVRIGKTIYTRKTEYHPWKSAVYSSLNAAKKANGTNGTTAKKLTEHPTAATRRSQQQQRKGERRFTQLDYEGNEKRKQERRQQERRKG